MEVAKALAEARRRAGLTQSQLARRAGTSQATVSAYESGRKVPSIETFARLLAATGSQLAVVEAPARRPSREELQRNGRVPTELAAFKVMFDRTRDWADVEAMLAAGTLDADALRAVLRTLVEKDDERIARLDGAEERSAAE